MRIGVLQDREYVKAARVMNMSFNANWTGDDSEDDLLKQHLESKAKGEIIPERIGAFDDLGELMAQVQFTAFKSFLWGESVPMEGIGGVATLPQFRRHGAIREIMREGYRRMNERGTVLTVLYPFSSSFYRKFSYESFVELEEFRFDNRIMEPVSNAPAGVWRMLQPREGASELHKQWERDYKTLSETVEARYQLATQRDESSWGRIIKSDESYEGKSFSYIFYRESEKSSEPLAVCSLDIGSEGERNQLNAYHIACMNSDGMFALLHFLRSFSNDQTKVRLALPTGSSPARYLKEHAGLGAVQRTFHGMIGLVNVQRFLEHYAKYAPDAVSFNVSVFDGFSKWNSGLYMVKMNAPEDGRVTFLPLQEENAAGLHEASHGLAAAEGLGKPDLCCEPAGLALLLAGLEDGEHLAAAGLIRAGSDQGERLSALRRQRVYLSDYF